MIVILLPLFLAATFDVSKDDWKYGREMVYNVKIDDAAYYDGPLNETFWYNITMSLHCRTKSDLCLSCHLHEPKDVTRGVYSSEQPRKSSNDGSIMFDIFDYRPFELIFDADGLKKLIVSSSIIPSKLNTLRAIVAQFNIGADFSIITKDEFEIMENFTTGTCKTKYVLSSRDTTENNKKITKNPYEMVIVPGMRKPKGEIMEIQRTRNLEDCSYRVDYIFGSRETIKSVHNITEAKVKASKSHMIISQRDFVSWTENTIIVKKLNSTITIAEKISLTLETIIPANGPIPTIQDPSTANIFPTRWLFDDSSSMEDSNDFN